MADDDAHPYYYDIIYRHMTLFDTEKLKNAYARFYEPESQHRIAKIYWPVLLSLTALLVGISASYGVLQFVMPPEPTLSNVNVSNASVGFSEEDLLHIVDRLETRKETFESLLGL